MTKKRLEDLVITVSGHHGSGRSTHALKLANSFGLRYISSGTIFRDMAKEQGFGLEEMSKLTEEDPKLDKMIDERARKESKKRGVVIDATLSGWMAVDPDLRIYLIAPFEERVRRIAERDGISSEEARRETMTRAESEHERFLKYYGINIEDLSIYDVVLNTYLFEPEATARILKRIVEEYCKIG
ncbi:MAG: AAA family ATPase [Candidatus Bathyarchaeota archaeon]|jgi:cytidylate kinase